MKTKPQSLNQTYVVGRALAPAHDKVRVFVVLGIQNYAYSINDVLCILLLLVKILGISHKKLL